MQPMEKGPVEQGQQHSGPDVMSQGQLAFLPYAGCPLGSVLKTRTVVLKMRTGVVCKLAPRRKQNLAPVVEDKPEAKPSKPGDQGPWFRVLANALHSKTYTGSVDFGTFTAEEEKKGKVQKRVEQLQAEGYKNIQVREIAKLAD